MFHINKWLMVFSIALIGFTAHRMPGAEPTGKPEVVKNMPDLVAFWPFGEEPGQPRVSVGTKEEHPLQEVGGAIARAEGGPYSAYSLKLDGKHYLSIPYDKMGDLNISGSQAQVSMFAVIQLTEFKRGVTIAGVWSEGKGANDDSGTRQYAMLLNMPTYGGSPGVATMPPLIPKFQWASGLRLASLTTANTFARTSMANWKSVH
jgi:hypothetical protein